MSLSESDEFLLYMSEVEIIENDYTEIKITYEGETQGIDRLLLIGENNALSPTIQNARVFKKELRGSRTIFVINFPIWQDGTFKAVIEKEGEYVYEPGEPHNLVFRGRGVFLNLRKIYHLSKEPVKPKIEKKHPEPSITPILKEKKIKEKKEKKTAESSIPRAYDENNSLIIKPKDFRVFGPPLKEKLLQVLDYLTNEQSRKLNVDIVLLPEIARAIKRCISDEMRASVFEICFPVAVLVQKALVLSNMVFEQQKDEELIEEYNKTVAPKAEELKKQIKTAEFKTTSELMKREYDDDVHKMKLMLLEIV